MAGKRVPRTVEDVLDRQDARLAKLERKGRGFTIPASVVESGTSYAQDTAPVPPLDIGSLWIDTSNYNKISRWDGTKWVAVVDPLIDRLRDAAAALLVGRQDFESRTDNLVTTYIANTEPRGGSYGLGDLWINSSTKRLFRWDGVAWIDQDNTEVGETYLRSENETAWADGRVRTYWQNSRPTASGFGDLWMDLTQSPTMLFRWNNFDWVRVIDWSIVDLSATVDTKNSTFEQDTPPVPRQIGDLWIDSANKKILKRWDGTKWVIVQDENIAEATETAKTVVKELKDKAAVFYNDVSEGDEEPVATRIDDVWFKPDHDYAMFRWNGADWVAVVFGPQSLADGAVTARNLAENAVTAQALANNAVTPLKIADGSILKDKLASGVNDLIDAATERSTTAAETADAARASADGKSTIYRQDNKPPSGKKGDTWFDTNDGNRIYSHNGTDFVDTRDIGIELSVTAANEAKTTADAARTSADGKSTIYRQPSKPLTGKKGDTWFDSDDGYKIYTHDGTDYVDTRDTGIAQAAAAAGTAQTAANTAQSTANAKSTIYRQDTKPASGKLGDTWFNTAENNKIYSHNGADFVDTQDKGITNAASAAATANNKALEALTAAQSAQATADGAITTYYQSNPPWENGTPQPDSKLGDLWFDTDDGQAFRWNGSAWQLIEDNSIAAALAAAQNAQTTADGKITTYRRNTQPWAPGDATHDLDFGDIWYHTGEGNRPYYWNNDRTWTLVQDVAIATAQTQANTALTTANGKNKVTYSNSVPGSTTNAAGDLWFTLSGTTVVSQWQGNGGTSWTQVALGDSAIANLDAAKIISGYIDSARINAGSITANKLSVTVGGGNLLSNSGFEDPGISPWGDGSGGTVFSSNSTRYVSSPFGSRSLRLVKGESFTYIAQNGVALQGKRAVTVSAMVYAEVATLFRAILRPNSGASYLSNTAAYIPANQWTRLVSTMLPTSADVTETQVALGWEAVDAAAGTVVYLDNVQCELGDIATAYAPKADEILPGTVSAAQMVTGTITAASGILADAVITTAKISDAAITNAKIANLDAAKITTGTLDAERIGANTVTANKLSVLAGGENMVSNSGFDVDTNSDGVADGYNRYTSEGGVLETSLVTDRKFGTRSQRLAWASLPVANAYIGLNADGNKNLGLDNTKPCVNSIWIKVITCSANTLFRLQMGLNPYASLTPGGPTVDISTLAGKGWTRLYYVHLGGSGYDPFGAWYVGPENRGSNVGSGEIYLDGYQIEQGDLATAYHPRTAEILPGTVSAAQMVTGTITAESAILADASVTNAKIATLDAGKIVTGYLSSDRIEAGSLVIGKVSGLQGTLNTTRQIADAASSSAELLTNSDFGVSDGAAGAVGWTLTRTTDSSGASCMLLETTPSGEFGASLSFINRLVPVTPGDQIGVTASYTQTDGTLTGITSRFHFMDGPAVGQPYDGVHHQFIDATNEINPDSIPSALNKLHTQLYVLTVPPGMRFMALDVYVGERIRGYRRYLVDRISAVRRDPNVVKAQTDAEINSSNAASTAYGETKTLVAGWRTTGTTTINGGQITTDSVSAAQIKAGSINAEKLTVASLGGELIVNGNFEQVSTTSPGMPVGWSIEVGDFGAIRREIGGEPGHPILVVQTQSNTTGPGARSVSRPFPVEGGAYYSLLSTISYVGSAPDAYIRIGWFTTRPGSGLNDNGNFNDTELTPYTDFLSASVLAGYGTGNMQDALKVAGSVRAPRSATYAAVTFYNYRPAAPANPSFLIVHSVSVRKQTVSAQIADGAITTDKIRAGSITAESGIIGSIDAAKITTGTLDANRIGANTINAEKLTVGSAGDNAILNGSFEEQSLVDPTMPAKWQKIYGWPAQDQSKNNVYRTNDDAASGSYCIRMSVGGTGENATFSAVDGVAVEAGEKWLMSIRLKGERDIPNGLYFRYSNQSGGEMSYGGTLESFGITTQWQTYYATITVPAGVSLLRPFFLLHGTVTGAAILRVDTLEVRRIISSVNIADGAITADKIVAGAITTEKLTVGTIGDNALPNGYVTDSAAVETTSPDIATIASGYRTPNADVSPGMTFKIGGGPQGGGTKSIGFVHPASSTTSTGNAWLFAPAVAVTPGEILYYSAQVYSVQAISSGIYLRFSFYNKSKPGSYNDGLINDTASVVENIGAPAAAWTRYDGQITVPAGAAFLVLRPHAWTGSGGTGSNQVFFSQMTVRRATVSATIADGAITAPKIQAGAVTTEKLTVASLGDNLVLNGRMLDNYGTAGDRMPYNWRRVSGGTYFVYSQPDAAAPGGQVLVVRRTASAYGGAGSAIFPVTPGSTYAARMRVSFVGTTPSLLFRMAYFDSSDAYLTYTDGIVNDPLTDASGSSTRVIRSASFVAPANARKAALEIYNFPSGASGSDSYLLINEVSVSEAVISVQIADGAVNANKITAGAISAEKLTVGSIGESSVLNGGFENELEQWQVGEANGSATITTSQYFSGSKSLALYRNTASGVAIQLIQKPTAYIPVAAGDQYYVSCRALGSSTLSSGFYLRAHWQNAAKAQISTSDPVANSGVSSGGWNPYGGTVTVPSGATYVGLSVYNTSTNSTIWVDSIEARRMIGGAQISQASILTANIGDAQITNLKVTSGIDASKMNVGYLNASVIDTNAITARMISSGAIDGKIITGALIRTSESGQRVELSSSGLIGYNSSGSQITSISSSTGLLNAVGATFNNINVTTATITGLTGTNANISGTISAGTTDGIQVKLSESGTTTKYGSLDFTIAGNSIGSLTAFNATQMRLSSPQALYIMAGNTNAYLYLTSTGVNLGSNVANTNGNLQLMGFETALKHQGGFVTTQFSTTTAAANCYLSSGSQAIIAKSSSLRANKLMIQEIETEHLKKFFEVPINRWFDKWMVERYVDALDPDNDSAEDNYEVEALARIPGVIMEDVRDAGLTEFLQYDENGNPNGVTYDRIGVAWIPLVKELRDEVDELKTEIAALKGNADTM